MKYILIIFTCALIACNSQSTSNNYEEEIKVNKPLNRDFYKNNQVLLTNQIQFKNREFTYGASAFLVKESDSTFVYTAMHLLGPAMGITPFIPKDSFALLLDSWLAFPRYDAITSDTISITGANFSKSEQDKLCLYTNYKNDSITPLIISSQKPQKGDSLYIIGCEYSDMSCYQKIFSGLYSHHLKHVINLTIDSHVNLAGFSGAPIINSSNEVVGIVGGASSFDGKTVVFGNSLLEK